MIDWNARLVGASDLNLAEAQLRRRLPEENGKCTADEFDAMLEQFVAEKLGHTEPTQPGFKFSLVPVAA